LIAQFEWHDESMAIDNGRTQPQQQSPVLPIPCDAFDVETDPTPKAFANRSLGLLQPWVQGQDRPNAESVG
jgi:hypothetical protein